MAANPSGAPISEDALVESISGILADEPEYAEEGQPEKEPSQKEAPEEQEGEEEVVEAAEEEGEPAEEPETKEIDPDEKWIEIEETLPDGAKETKTYSLNELKAQRMMQADYSRKTEELSRQRKELNEQLRQGIEKEKSQFLEALQVQQRLIQEMVLPELPNLDRLAEEDPAEYLRVQRKVDKVNQIVQNIQAEQYRAQQEQLKHLQEQVLPAELEKVQRAIPNWGQEVKSAILEVGQTYDFTPDELNMVVDSRMIRVLHDAAQYQKLKAQKPAVTQKVKEKPKVMKGGTRSKEDPSADAKQRLKKSGRYQDAAAIIAERLTDIM